MNLNLFQKQTIFLFILSYLLIVYWIFIIIDDHDQSSRPKKSTVTILIIEFENFHNNLIDTVDNFCQSNNDDQEIIIFTDSFIYPPIDFRQTKCKNLNLIESSKSILIGYDHKNIYNAILGEFLLILPDFTRIVDHHHFNFTIIQILIDKLKIVDLLLLPLTSEPIECQSFYFDYKRWTLNFYQDDTRKSYDCLFNGGFAIFISKKIFFKFSYPLLRPVMQSLLLQSQLFNLTVKIFNDQSLFLSNKSLPLVDPHTKIKLEHYEKQRLLSMYRKLDIKRVNYPNNDSTKWYGCDRDHPRCFGSILNDIPDYLVQSRYLPPCCRRNLEITGHYVLELLEKSQIRYWLEGGSLLGAARNGQIIDWDYDIDIGIYQDDMHKLSILKNLFEKKSGYQIEDGNGFLWEKAIEGDFIKIHYSRINRIHVDIFPFYSRNNTMTKDTWLANHPQDRPFPEHFLQPLKRMEFIGRNVSVPNNVRKFLELKFGTNAIEEPKFPNNFNFIE